MPKLLETLIYEYVDAGFSTIPIHPETKKPFVSWRQFQHSLPTDEDIANWQLQAQRLNLNPDEIRLAFITGKQSGFVIVDCDTEEAANFCMENGVWSPVRARTKRGVHLYFRHEGDVEWRPRAGSNSKGTDWPKLPGLDFRGDGSYAVCPPSSGYEWVVDEGFDLNNINELPVWNGWPKSGLTTDHSASSTDFSSIDFSTVEIRDTRSVWHQTADYVRESFPDTLLIPTGQGNGRNYKILQYASEQILYGHWGDDLDQRIIEFMDNFFCDHLSTDEWSATARSVETMEMQNHPERFDASGNYVPTLFETELATITKSDEDSQETSEDEDDDLISLEDTEELLKDYHPTYIVEPVIPSNCVIHISGYTGQGKSTFLQLLVHAMGAGVDKIGPYKIIGDPTVMYLNYEEGQRTIKERFKSHNEMIGNLRKDSKKIWMYFKSMAKGKPMDLMTLEGRKLLVSKIMKKKPDVLVIDTMRSAFVGLDENDAKAWGGINNFIMAIKTKLDISVIMLHHRNKPTEDGYNYYAGSTAQLNIVEQQLYISMLYEDEEVAKAAGGVFDKVEDGIFNFHKKILNTLPGGAIDWSVDYLMRVGTGKLRNDEPKFDKSTYIAKVTNIGTGETRLTHLPSTYEQAINLYNRGLSTGEICTQIGKPISIIEKWVAEHLRQV